MGMGSLGRGLSGSYVSAVKCRTNLKENVMGKPHVYRCKIGTMPAWVILCRKYKPNVGTVMWVRNDTSGSRPYKVKVTRRNPDGYFFATLV